MKPLNPAQEKFAQLVATGTVPSQAYREAYPNVKKPDACASKLQKIAKVAARIAELRAKVAEFVCMERAEGLQYLTEAIRTPIAEIDATNPLCQEHVVTTGDGWETVKHKSVGKLDAWDKLAKALGWYAPEKFDVTVTGSLTSRVEQRNAERRQLLGSN